MTDLHRGDVVLVRFVFADETGFKVRPALVVSAQAYHGARHELIIAAITSNVGRRLFGDTPLHAWTTAGLVLPSQVTGILRTVTRAMVAARLGAVEPSELAAVEQSLRGCLAL
jgi:mRNA-degrading endonuclease toxin of MazEF toxin-antitoxin module